MIINEKKLIIGVIIIIVLIAVAGFLIYYPDYSLEKKSKEILEKRPGDVGRPPCLLEDEIVNYPLSEEYSPESKIPKTPVIIIYIKDKKSGEEKFSFQIDYVDPLHYHPLEIHKCGVYVVRKFNYDPAKSEQEPGFKAEIWQYQYNGQSKNLILLAIKDTDRVFKAYYSYDFRVDHTENYVSLMRYNVSDNKPLNPANYALVIRNLGTKEDVFVLSPNEIVDKYPNLEGSIGFNEWTEDGRYFWASIFYGANVLGFIRIDISNWTYEVFPAPKDVLGGDALNVEKGYITVHPGNAWFGIHEFTEGEKERRRKEGIGTELYIHNLITGKHYFVDKTDEPLWYFKPKWISEIELEYELPTGEKRIYKINE